MSRPAFGVHVEVFFLYCFYVQRLLNRNIRLSAYGVSHADKSSFSPSILQREREDREKREREEKKMLREREREKRIERER
ncbi:hypothetical protein DPMN_119204 [Dreissena polymorpha]|uniref:Uncharacterized protein n=1 Tax=Dreissena polymorpha TaxID=45954 RepID=A0A9D4GLH5_DREPO|nr:hypothetical protein DPMN_119204 [Dreissena polymorpha]